LRLEKATVLKLISWKHSFKRLNEEYEIAKKKKQALDNLFETGRISQATRDSFENDITAVIMEIEKQQKDLLGKMQGKTQELESQIKTLETLLANYEIEHVVGEIDEESYQREITLLSTGLETAKHELEVIKEATNQLCPPVEAPTTEPSLPAEESKAEVVQNEPVESTPVAPAEVEVEVAPSPEEPAITTEEAVPEQPEIESKETIPAEVSPAEEDTPQVVEEMPEAIAETPEIIEETPEVTAEVPQVIEDVPQEIEDTAEVVEETPELAAEVPQAVEDAPEAVEELSKEAHPQKAPEEAQPEIIVESIPEQEQAAEETDENTENQEEA
jgi:hypothetical protein